MHQRLLSNIAFLVFVNLLIKPFWILGIDRVVQNTVGSADYGIYFAIFNFSFLFHIILDMGINNFNSRTIAREPEKLSEYLSGILGIKALLAMAYVVVTFAIAFSVKYDAFQLKLLSFMAFNQVLISLIFYFRSNVAALHHFRFDALLSVLDRSLMIAICAFLLWGPFSRSFFQIEWFVYAQTIAYALTVVVSFALVLKLGTGIRWKFNASSVFSILKKTYPFALVGIFMSLYNRLDAVMLERMLVDGKQEAGIYAASFRLLDAVNMVGYLFAAILLPAFSRILKNREDFVPILKASFNAIFVIAWPVAVCCYFFSGPIMELLYPAANEYWFSILELLLFSFVPISCVYIFGTLLVANGNMLALNLIVGAGVLVNLSLNLALIPEHKGLGATFATLVTQAVVALAHVWVAKSTLKLKTDIRLLARLLAFALFTLLVFAGGDYFSGEDFSSAAMSIASASLATLVFAWFLRLVNFGQLLSLTTRN